MLRYALTHPYTDDDDDPDTSVFYDTLVDRIHDLTVLANQNGNDIELEWDEDGSSVTVTRV
jgi:hypothetical protein